MAGALPDNIYRSTEDMSLTSEETANDFDPVGSNATASRLGGTSSTDSRNSGEGNVGLTPTASAYEHATTVLGYDVQEHTNPSTVKIKELSIKYARLMETNERLQAQLIESNTNMVSKQGECSQMHTKLEESNEKIKRLEDENQSSVIENAGVRDELKRAVDMHQTAVKKYTDATNMVSQLQKEKGEIHEQLLQKSGVENNQIKNELASMNIRVKDLENQKAALDDEVKQLSEKNRTLYTTVYETGFKHHTDMTNKQKEKDELQIKLTSKEAERCQLQVWLDEAYEKIRILENQNQSSVNEAERQQNPGEASEMAAAVECEGAAKIEIRKDSVDIYNPSKIKVGLNNL